jgi:hypothetical protein
MKAVRLNIYLAVVLGLLAALPVFAGSGDKRDGEGDEGGHGSDGDKKTTVTPPPPGQKSGMELPGLNLPPGLREQLSPKVLEQLSKFQAGFEDYLKNRRELSEKLRAATGDQKKDLLDKLRSDRERFLGDTRELRTEINNQIAVQREKLRQKGGSTRPGGRP